MYEPVQRCNNCGANLSLDDLRGTNCRFCGTVFPHHAQAAQHAEMAGKMMNQMMAQQGQLQNQWRAGYGFGSMPGGAPPPIGRGGAPMGPPGYGMPPPPMGASGYPYADPQRIAAAHMASSAKLSGMIMAIVIGTTVLGLLIAGGVVAFVLMR